MNPIQTSRSCLGEIDELIWKILGSRRNRLIQLEFLKFKIGILKLEQLNTRTQNITVKKLNEVQHWKQTKL